nr:hypothetical protein [Mobilicoccus sp.]
MPDPATVHEALAVEGRIDGAVGVLADDRADLLGETVGDLALALPDLGAPLDRGGLVRGQFPVQVGEAARVVAHLLGEAGGLLLIRDPQRGQACRRDPGALGDLIGGGQPGVLERTG